MKDLRVECERQEIRGDGRHLALLLERRAARNDRVETQRNEKPQIRRAGRARLPGFRRQNGQIFHRLVL